MVEQPVDDQVLVSWQRCSLIPSISMRSFSLRKDFTNCPCEPCVPGARTAEPVPVRLFGTEVEDDEVRQELDDLADFFAPGCSLFKGGQTARSLS